MYLVVSILLNELFLLNPIDFFFFLLESCYFWSPSFEGVTWSVRLGVRTSGFHPENRGSIPLRTTKNILMANHKSTKKRIRSSKTRQESNKYLHKTVRNAMREVLSDTSKESAKKTPKIVSMIDKLEKKNVIHKNKAARLKSKLMKKSN